VAIIGLGKMGILHSGILNSIPGTRVRAICEKESYLVKAGRALLPRSVSFYTNYLEMIEKEDLDAVYITTPINTHVPMIVDVARANEHISLFVEKPLAASSQAAKEACDAVANSRGVHAVGFQKRFSPVFIRAKELLTEGGLGDLMFFRSYSYSSDVLREGSGWRFSKGSGGVLLDLAPHLLDLLIWFFDEPEAVTAVKRRIYSREVDDYVHAALSFKSGLKGYVDTCWSMRAYRLPEVVVEVYGKHGALTVTDDFVRIATEKERNGIQLMYKSSFDNSVPFLLADPEYTKENQNFLACLEKKNMPECNFLEAAKVNRLIERIADSAQ
jgi:predicted dehydrogenase